MTNNTSEKTVLIYQAFGIPEAFDQVAFSLLTLYHVQNGDFSKLHPVVYTDNAQRLEKYFAGFPFTFIQLSEKTIQDYKGPQNYFHRMRHFIIKDCFDRFRSNIIYIDGDTFFMKSPESIAAVISPEVSVMHVKEYTMEDGGDFEGNNWLELRRLIRKNIFYKKGKEYKVPFSAVMWNAGVVGVAYENRSLIDDAIELIDQILPVSTIFTAEQLATGFVLQTNTQVVASDEVIFHYWPGDLKNAYNHLLREFLKKNEGLGLPELATKAFGISKQKDKLPRLEPSFWARVKLRLDLVKKVALKGSL